MGIEVARALTLVWLASRSVGPSGTGLPDDPGRIVDVAADHWAVVHQAAGMVAVQVGCDLDDAMARLGARAFAVATPIAQLAQLVVARELRFRP